MLTGKIQIPEETKEPPMSPITELSEDSSKSYEINPKAVKLAQIENKKHSLMSQLGGDKFKKIYDYIRNAR